MGADKTAQIYALTDTVIHEKKIVGLAKVIDLELLVWSREARVWESLARGREVPEEMEG